MSAPQKLRSGPESELTKLKEVWLRMPDDARSYWSARFVTSEVKQSDIRKEILAKLKINLRFDPQLNKFRDWVRRQDALDVEAEAMQEDERRLQEEFGAEWTLDRIREEVLRRSYARALSTGDFASGRKTIVQDLNVKKVMLDERKVALLERKAAAFDAAKEVIESTLSPEEQRLRIKEILK